MTKEKKRNANYVRLDSIYTYIPSSKYSLNPFIHTFTNTFNRILNTCN